MIESVVVSDHLTPIIVRVGIAAMTSRDPVCVDQTPPWARPEVSKVSCGTQQMGAEVENFSQSESELEHQRRGFAILGACRGAPAESVRLLAPREPSAVVAHETRSRRHV